MKPFLIPALVTAASRVDARGRSVGLQLGDGLLAVICRRVEPVDLL
jgi:hypothetical protein